MMLFVNETQNRTNLKHVHSRFHLIATPAAVYLTPYHRSSPITPLFSMTLSWMQVERDNLWIMSKLAPLHYRWQATPVYISYVALSCIIWTLEHVTCSFVYNTRPSALHLSPLITLRAVFLLILAAALVRVNTYVLLWPYNVHLSATDINGLICLSESEHLVFLYH